MSDSGEENADLFASDTESDDNVEENDSGEEDESDDSQSDDELEDDSMEDSTNSSPAAQKKTRQEVISEQILNRYKEKQGKQLYVRFPKKLPEDTAEFEQKIRSLFPSCIRGHKPRQKHARFCLIDYASKEERDLAYKDLRSQSKKGGNLKGFVILLPRTEHQEFVDKLVEKKIETFEKRRARKLLQRQAKRQEAAASKKNYTSTIVVRNLPSNASEGDLKKLFPDAIDIHLKSKKDKKTKSTITIAAVTMQSSFAARGAIRQKYELHGKELRLRFDVQKTQRDLKNPAVPCDESMDDNEERENLAENFEVEQSSEKSSKKSKKSKSKNIISQKKKDKSTA